MRCMFVSCWNDAVFSFDHVPFSGRTSRVHACAKCAEQVGARPRWDTGIGFMNWWLSEMLPTLHEEAKHRAAWGGCSLIDVLREEF